MKMRELIYIEDGVIWILGGIIGIAIFKSDIFEINI